MGLWEIINTIVASNVGVSFDSILLILLVLGSLILRAKNFQVGTILSMVISAIFFIVFYETNLNWSPFLILFFIDLVLLTLSIWASIRSSEEGSYI